ncbi:MAG TPA: hypothetical protein VH835_09165 [Dongiaceae bacterium]
MIAAGAAETDVQMWRRESMARAGWIRDQKDVCTRSRRGAELQEDCTAEHQEATEHGSIEQNKSGLLRAEGAQRLSGADLRESIAAFVFLVTLW